VRRGAGEWGAAGRLRRPDAARARREAPSSYEAVSVPVALIVGEHDALVPRESWQPLADQLPGVRTAVIAGAGHYPQIERAARFTAQALEFLAAGAGP
jgi:pimeloyl-ACP methyl ester carboxylesterase